MIVTIILNCVVLGSESKLPGGDSVKLNQILVRSVLHTYTYCTCTPTLRAVLCSSLLLFASFEEDNLRVHTV